MGHPPNPRSASGGFGGTPNCRRDAGSTHRGGDFLKGALLVRVKGQRLGGQNCLAAVRVALGNLRRDGDQPLVFQTAQGLGGCVGRLQQFLEGQFSPLADDVEDLRLAFAQFRLGAVAGRARTKSCSRQPSFSLRTASGKTVFSAISGGQQ